MYVQAAGNSNATYTLLEPLPVISGGKATLQSTINMSDFFQYAFNILIALAAVTAVFMMVWGGFLYVTTDSWDDKKNGKEYFKNALYGFLMILGAYIILKTINPKLVSLPASIPAIESANTESPLSVYEQEMSNSTETYNYLKESGQLKSENETLIEEKSILQQQYDAASASLGEDDASVKAMAVQLAQYDKTINENKANIVVNNAKAQIVSRVELFNIQNDEFSAINSNNIQDDIEKKVAEIADSASKARGELSTLQATEQILQIEDYANYATDSLMLVGIQSEFENVNMSASEKKAQISKYTEKISQIEKEAGLITDPSLKQEILDQINNTKSALKEKFK